MPKTEEVKFKKGDLVKYEARIHKGTGVFLRYEPSLKGVWIVLKRDDNGNDLALRVSQVKPRAGKPAAAAAKAVKPTPTAKPVAAAAAPVAAKPKRIRPSRAEQRARAAAKAESTAALPAA